MTSTQEERQGRARYGGALALLLAAYVLDAIDRAAIDLIVSFILIAVLSLLLLDPHTPRSLRIIGLFAALASVLSTVLAEALDLSDTYLGISHIANVIVLAVAMAALINRLRHMHQVTISTVMEPSWRIPSSRSWLPRCTAAST